MGLDIRPASLLAQAFGRSPVAKIVVRLAPGGFGDIVEVNDAFCELLGHHRADLVGRSPRILLADDDLPAVARLFDALIRGEIRENTIERVLVARDGTRLRVSTRNTVVRDDHGGRYLVGEILESTETARESDRLRTTIRVQREITAAAADRTTMLQLMADRTLQVVPAGDLVAVQTVDVPGGMLRVVAGTGRFDSTTLPPMPLAGTLTGIVVATNCTLRCDDTRVDPRADRGLAERTGTRSLIMAPLRSPGGAPFGVLMVGSAEPGAFDTGDEQLLTLLADALSGAVQHAEDVAEREELLHRANAAVTALEQERAAVQRSERQFAEVFDHSPVAKMVVGLRGADRGRILLANPAFLDLLGYTREQAMRLHIGDITTRPVEQLERGLTLLASGEQARGMNESVLIRSDGTRVDALSRTSAIADERGPVTAVVQVLDVSAERQARAELERSASELRRQARLLDLIPAAVIVRDPDGTIHWWNTGASDLYGWPLQAALGKSTHRLFATGFPDEDSAARQRETLLRDGAWNGQLLHLTAEGRTLTVLSRQVLDHPAPGEAQILEINTDVTAARAAELALVESEQRFRAQFVNSAVGQLVCALDGRIVDANPAYAAMIGYSVEQLTGVDSQGLAESAVLAGSRDRIAALFAGEADSYLYEGRIRHADGHGVDVEATVSLVRDSEDRPKHLVAVVSDISARRTAERARDAAAAALTERNTELEAANQLKLDIIGMLGHEIGNPLTTIQGNAEILAEDWAALGEDHRTRVVDAIVRQAGRLDEIVREVLAMVTLDAGLTAADRSELSAHDEIRQALAAAGAEAVPIRGPGARVLFHPGHLQQILVNLLSNATKYGGGATAIEVAAEGPWVRIAVEDSGPGVPEEFRARLFERLARADRDAGSVKGTGLGLYIVQGLAHANQADIHHEPRPGGGSRFVLTLAAA